VEEALGKIAGVKKVGELPTDERAHVCELVSERTVDLRPEVFQLMVDRGWVLLELHRDTQTLEDVFRSLTIGDERRNRHLGAAAESVDEDDDEEDEDDERQDEGPSRAARAEQSEKAAKADRS
jgi:ABC-2 type transport system ATP-binding protein